MKVNVKWGKELFNDIEVNTTQPPIIFKSQLFTLSGVPPERQKVLIKGGQLKDEEWGKQQPKEGMTIMMMGSADEIKVEAPTNAPKFVEDLPGVLLLLLLLLLFQLPMIRACDAGERSIMCLAVAGSNVKPPAVCACMQ